MYFLVSLIVSTNLLYEVNVIVSICVSTVANYIVNQNIFFFFVSL